MAVHAEGLACFAIAWLAEGFGGVRMVECWGTTHYHLPPPNAVAFCFTSVIVVGIAFFTVFAVDLMGLTPLEMVDLRFEIEKF